MVPICQNQIKIERIIKLKTMKEFIIFVKITIIRKLIKHTSLVIRTKCPLKKYQLLVHITILVSG